MVETLARRKVDTAALQEVSYRKEETRLIRGDKFQYKLYWVVGQFDSRELNDRVKSNKIN